MRRSLSRVFSVGDVPPVRLRALRISAADLTELVVKKPRAPSQWQRALAVRARRRLNAGAPRRGSGLCRGEAVKGGGGSAAAARGACGAGAAPSCMPSWNAAGSRAAGTAGPARLPPGGQVAVTCRGALRQGVAETFVVARLAVRLYSYLGLGWRWTFMLARLIVYAVLLMPGFAQVGRSPFCGQRPGRPPRLPTCSQLQGGGRGKGRAAAARRTRLSGGVWGVLQMVVFYMVSPRVKRSLVYGPAPRNRLDLYLPPGGKRKAPVPVVIYITGARQGLARVLHPPWVITIIVTLKEPQLPARMHSS